VAPPALDPALLLDARDAWRRRDRARLAADKAAALATRHPLAQWADYWELTNRLAEVTQDELEGFYARWPGTYLEDRLRNDWLLELGHRRDWLNFAREYPRFRMNDDREVACYALVADHDKGKDVVDAARAAWLAVREPDEGCQLLATTMFESKRFKADDLWRGARQAVEFSRPRAARFVLTLLGDKAAAVAGELIDQPARYMTRRASTFTRQDSELATLALMRMATSDADAAAGLLQQRWQDALPKDLAAIAWATVAKQSALKLQPEAPAYFNTAWQAAHPRHRQSVPWSDDTLAWGARAALRSAPPTERWKLVQQYVEAMSANAQQDPAWIYWRARALQATAGNGTAGEAQRQEAQQGFNKLAGQLDFYGLLATEELGKVLIMPSRPAPLTAAERAGAEANPGLQRALQLIGIGLRNEGVREWNYAIRGLGERELLAAAQLACDREVWDRCINTSERTKLQVDIAQRYPLPHRDALVAKARELGVDPAYVYGLIRQESRFVTDARSSVGASGLMQVMPATAQWTARKLGLRYTPDMITQRDTNLHLGTGYLKLVLDDFQGSQALAAAAYNAGPNRSRRWREGPVLEPAVWAENVPFNETRDYVKKVLSNAVLYAGLLDNGRSQSLKARLGPSIGPRDSAAPAPSADLP
jgi:soluble lytic murein transglycosylase